MIQTKYTERQRAFSHWLRTGRLPPVHDDDGLELKFNPWHDPDDGRFTFAGTGNHFGAGEVRRGGTKSSDAVRRTPKIVFKDSPAEPKINSKADADAWRAKNLAKYGADPANRRAIEAKYAQYIASLEPAVAPITAPPEDNGVGRPSNPLSEFATGMGEGAVGSAKDAAEAAYAMATTNPVTTILNIENGLADNVDQALAAEDIPARVQMSRAAKAVANASARDIGRAVGSTAANAALAAAPGAAATKISSLRQIRRMGRRPEFPPPEIHWVNEDLGRDTPAKRYNDAGTGAQPGKAPALKRTLPDGLASLVKFDGIDGDYLIDRKTGIRRTKKFKDQTLRQSDVLAQHGLIALWEFPNEKVRAEAARLLKSLGVKNIKSRVVKQ